MLLDGFSFYHIQQAQLDGTGATAPCDEPYFVLAVADYDAIAAGVFVWGKSDITVRIVRDRKSESRSGLFDEFAAALQFPLYFGENWDAFEECISELESLPHGVGIVIVVTEPDRVLCAEPEAMQQLVAVLESASRMWSQVSDLDEPRVRQAVPFHVLLAASDKSAAARVAARWQVAGAHLADLRSLP